ncbi:MAG: DUF3015 domain-containing protein [Helicobacteraceae bacterium]|jgi:hypothetical protein|nr:DUF3015 domain-containing protein [Helicobacteraceae bacterium]
MKKVFLSVAIAGALATSSFALFDGQYGGNRYSASGCGLGNMLFANEKDKSNDLASQILGATVNGTGSQIFAITTGTSGCNPSGVFASNEELNNFTGQNLNKLASDMSKGSGETLDAFADLAGVSDKPAFFAAAQANFDKIFTSADISAGEVLTNMDAVL